jgi:adenylate kinase
MSKDGISSLKFGDVMLELGIEDQLVRDKDGLDELNLRTRSTLQRKAAKLIDGQFRQLPLVIDGHMIVETRSGLVPGLPLDCASDLKLNAIVLLDAPPNEIMRRRVLNNRRYGLDSTPEAIANHQRALFHACMHYAILSEGAFKVVPTVTDASATAKLFLEYLKNLIRDVNPISA